MLFYLGAHVTWDTGKKILEEVTQQNTYPEGHTWPRQVLSSIPASHKERGPWTLSTMPTFRCQKFIRF